MDGATILAVITAASVLAMTAIVALSTPPRTP